MMIPVSVATTVLPTILIAPALLPTIPQAAGPWT
jgi:hypothetical protein